MPGVSENTREYLLGALARLIEKKDFDAISVSELTKVAGISRMTFYRHYGNVADVLSQELARLVAMLPEYKHLPVQEYGAAMMFYMRFFSEHAEFLQLLLKAGQEAMLRQAVMTVMTNLAASKESLQNFTDAEKRYYILYQAAGLDSVIIDWLAHGQQETPEQMATFIQKTWPPMDVAPNA
ncbi:TetR/AcrR family transcriptional regulator [Lacticaseibacillus brantae]|nr:TetR/AcrR family transcriptional regulator [Lacticaseibacillus brantae]